MALALDAKVSIPTNLHIVGMAIVDNVGLAL